MTNFETVSCNNADLKSQRPPADLTILDLVNTTLDLREISIIRDSIQILKIKDTPYPALNEEDFDGGRFSSLRHSPKRFLNVYNNDHRFF